LPLSPGNDERGLSLGLRSWLGLKLVLELGSLGQEGIHIYKPLSPPDMKERRRGGEIERERIKVRLIYYLHRQTI
jgi:hypothetical protein